MKRLMNLSAHASDFERFESSQERLLAFLEKHQLHGYEVIFDEKMSLNGLPSVDTIGVHMCFWPMWLDFWNADHSRMSAEFGDLDTAAAFYGGTDRSQLVKWYRGELEAAERIGAKYAVFHVSHVRLEHCYTHDFDYTDAEVFTAFVELINEVFEGFTGKLELLLENQWWPGLKLTDAACASQLLEAIRYPRKGFMLDIGHLMNTNLELQDEAQAVAYMLDVLDRLGPIKDHIKGIHLNSSLSGDYVKATLENKEAFDASGSFLDRYLRAYGHIGRVDQHQPFVSEKIVHVVEAIQPKYLVHEFTTRSLEELDRFIEKQNKALGI